MDPNLFRLDWEMLAETLAVLVFLSFAVERALAPIFEHRLYVNRLKNTGLKEPIAFLLALVICKTFGFDAMGITLKADATSFVGFMVTAAIIAGGSKASIKLFHDVLNIKSTVQKNRDDVSEAKAKADVAAARKSAALRKLAEE